jgi:hypothetical protein
MGKHSTILLAEGVDASPQFFVRLISGALLAPLARRVLVDWIPDRITNEEGVGQPWRQRGQACIGQTDEPRPQKSRRAQVGRRIGEKPYQRHRVLRLVSVEETQSLVNVGGDGSPLELALELPVAGARPEQYPDVARAGAPRQTRFPIAHAVLAENPVDLVRDDARARLRIVGYRDPELESIVPTRVIRAPSAIRVIRVPSRIRVIRVPSRIRVIRVPFVISVIRAQCAIRDRGWKPVALRVGKSSASRLRIRQLGK